MTLEDRVSELEAFVAKLMEAVPEASMDDKCRKRECSYHTDYLPYGAAELTHERYHAECEAFTRHMQHCTGGGLGKPCRTCSAFEERVRA